MPASRKRLRCFVAMAIGTADTDALCDSIESVLKPMGIDAVRVDRIIHNDDVDDRIFAEIKAADFVIADLTYARPSVYFEAGYAERAIPVIYTVRKDHFTPKPDDTAGNLRVHFDLQMRNIIAWQSDKHKAFLAQLVARVRKIISPLVLKKQEDEALKLAVLQFDGLSIRDKQAQLVALAERFFHNLGYKIERRRDVPFPHGTLPHGAFTATRVDRKGLHFILFHVPPSLTVSDCDLYQSCSRYCSFYDEHIRPPKRLPKRIYEDFIICSLGSSGSINRLRKRIPHLQIGDAANTLMFENPRRIDRFKSDAITVPRTTTFHIFESTPRLLALGAVLSERFS